MTAMMYTLLINDAPANPEIVAAIQRIEVEESTDLADMIRLQIGIGVNADGSDWTVLEDNPFTRFAKVKLLVSVGGNQAEPLIDARVIETSMTLSDKPHQSVLNVVAMDITVEMNLRQYPQSFSNQTDSSIAESIFRKYNLQAIVDETDIVHQEDEKIVVHHGTDAQLLRKMALRNGFECYVEVNPSTGIAEGHFHKPRLKTKPQGVLSVNLGEATNVNTFNVRYDMLRPSSAEATGLDIESLTDQHAETDAPKEEKLGTTSTIGQDKPREDWISQSGMSSTDELQALVQASVDRSSWSIVAEGELNTIAFGRILRAKCPVKVRGIGKQLSGVFYVERVLHIISGEGYIQRFTLRRNAVGMERGESFTE